MNEAAHPGGGNRTCALRAYGTARATADEIAVLRKQPGPQPGARPLPGNLLNHADDQTVVAVAAVLNAVARFGLQSEPFQDWAVVGAPRFPGRAYFATAIDKFARSGSLSVSPIIVPYLSLHAVASMITLTLRIQGPALGVGGGADSLGQALLMGLSLQQEQALPGVWVVATGWDPEPFDGPADAAPPAVCQAAALALLPDASAGLRSGELRLRTGDAGPGGPPNLTELVQLLSSPIPPGQARSMCCSLAGDNALELTATTPQAGLSQLARSA